MPAPLPDLTSVLDLARRDAALGEQRGALTGDVVAALRAAGCFALHTPTDLGGPGLSLPDACDVIAEISEADGAAGWAAMIGAGPAWFAAHMDPAGAREVFGGGGAVSGSAENGTATRDADGWIVDGRWAFCSGAPWADWFTFNAAHDDGVVTVAIPADRVTVHPETWDVRGMRATASCDASVTGVHVPSSRAFVVGERPGRDEPVFRVDFVRFAEATMAAVLIGLARAAVRGTIELAERKMRRGSRVADDPGARATIARAAGAAEAAIGHVRNAITAIWADAVDGRTDTRHDAVMCVAAIHMARTAVRVADALAAVAGTSALPVESALGRTFGDIRAAATNAVLAESRLAGVDPAALVAT